MFVLEEVRSLTSPVLFHQWGKGGGRLSYLALNALSLYLLALAAVNFVSHRSPLDHKDNIDYALVPCSLDRNLQPIYSSQKKLAYITSVPN